jgi:predicted nucleotide-binding protein
MPKKSDRTTPKEQIVLLVSRAQLASELQARIAAGTELRDRVVTDAAGVKQLRADHYTWDEYNFDLLRMRFSHDSIASEYRGFTFGIADDDNPGRELTRRKEDIASDIRKLESIESRLTIYSEGASVVHKPTERPAAAGERVFVVHGHDAGKRDEVARLLERLGLNATILSEQANAGLTLIEKFESHAGEVAFAVVVLTGDDEGGPPGGPYRARGRQNVVLELGFFYGRLGRGRVCLLYEADVELPSDIAGVAYVQFDASGAWKMLLARELRQAGLPVDMNRL